jgi:hypothetical protein
MTSRLVFLLPLLMIASACKWTDPSTNSSSASQLEKGAGTAPSPTPTPRPLKPAFLEIENGQKMTSASALRLQLKATEGWKMKISENAKCEGGDWETYSTQKLWTLQKKNQLVSLSVVFQDYDEMPSQCATASILHDDQGPSISITEDAKNTHQAGDDTVLNLEVKDTGSGVQTTSCQINDLAVSCSLGADGKGTLTFPAQKEGRYTLTVQSQDAVGNRSSVTQSWTVGVKYRHITQNVSLQSQSKVDILLIDDNSGSMQYEQKNMAKRMGTFVAKLQGLDWRIGITTTDPRDIALGDGRLIALKGLSGTYYLTSGLNPAQAQEILGATIQRSETGHDQEQGIYATYRAIERSLDPKDKTNAGFIRPDAAFSAVVISDEDESAGGAKNLPANLVKFVQTKFNGQKKFVFHSIITKPGDKKCASTNGMAYGNAYAKLSNLTGAGTVGGAIIGSVCEVDYASQLNGIGQSIQDMKKFLDLQCAPVGDPKSSVQITLNGQPFHERYEIQGLKITFDKALPSGSYKLDYDCN